MAKIRVFIADDHVLVRAGIRVLLEQIAGVEVVGEASDGREAMECITNDPPDILLLDIAMKGLNGLDAAARIRIEHPDTKVIILSMHGSEEYVLRALDCGVNGYLLKESATAELEVAVLAVASGKTYLSPAVSMHVIDRYRQRTTDEPGRTGEQLTTRQREILQLIAEGVTVKDIAIRLHLSAKTVETHRAQLMERLGIHDIPGLVRYALRNGIISLE